MNDQYPIESWETGSTQPPKSRGGLIAAVLGAVILLCGISTYLGLLNIRLSLQLHSGDNPNISFSKDDSYPTETLLEDPTESDSDEDTFRFTSLGFDGQAVTPLEQRFYQLPAGYWVTDVQPDSAAAKAGIQSGDILLSVNGSSITDAKSLHEALYAQDISDTVQIMIYRDNEQVSVLLCLDEEA